MRARARDGERPAGALARRLARGAAPGSGIHRQDRVDADLAARPAARSAAGDTGRMLWFDTITGLNDDNACAGCHSPTNGFGDTQSIAIGDRQQRHRRAGPRRAAQPAAGADGAQHGVLPEPDVERPLLVALRRPVRSSAGFLFPAPEGTSLSVPAAPARRAGVHPADRAGRGGGLRLRRRQRRDPSRGGAAAQRRRRLPEPFAKVVPEVATRRADHLRHVRRARSPSSSSRSRSRTPRSTASRAATTNALDDAEKRGASSSSARPAASAATRWPGRRTRCSATSAST